MSHYWLDVAARAEVDRLAAIATLCSSSVTTDEARYSARSKSDLAFLTDLYGTKFFWLPFDGQAEQHVADIRTALWDIGAGRSAQTTDVIVAATALRHDAVVVHNDTDFITVQRAVPEFAQLRIIPTRPGAAGTSP